MCLSWDCFSSESHIEEARQFYKAKQFGQAFEKYYPLAKQGNPEAQYCIGNMFYKGNGVKQNFKEAFEWYLKAAAQNLPEAQYNLSQMYYYGKGTEINDQQSLHWVMKAAQNGVSYSQLNLSARYRSGKGVMQDCSQAVYWVSQAADQGNPTAQVRLGIMYIKGICVKENDTKALEYLRKAAVQNEPYSQYLLARIHLKNGRRKEGLTLLFLSAKNGYIMADVAAGMLFLSYKQKEKAQKWFAKAEEQNALSASYIEKAKKRGQELQNCKTDQERDHQVFAFLEDLQPKELLDKENYSFPPY